MRLRLPIYAKVVGWLFLNLLLIGIIGFLFIRDELALGLNSILAGEAGQRIQTLTDQVVNDLRAAPDDEWDSVLADWNKKLPVTLLAFGASGTQIAGVKTELPPEVKNQVTSNGGGSRAKLPRRLPPPRLAQPVDSGNESEVFYPPQGRGRPDGGRDASMNGETRPRGPGRPSGPGGLGPRPGGPGGIRPAEFSRFTVRTTDPTRYWVGVRAPLFGKVGEGRQPVALMMVSDSLTAGGLFFDPTPWIWVVTGSLSLSVLLWFPFVRGLNRELKRVTEAADGVSEGRFDVKLDEGRGDELGQLSIAINRMAGRLDGFVDGQRRFLGAIAHELCSPLARLQMAIGILEQRADEKQQPYLDDLREEIEHMSNLVNELLSFSKASLAPSEVKLEPVRLVDVAREAAQREAASEREVIIDVPQDLHALANKDLVQRAVSNLVRNALRYAGHKGPVEISGRREGPIARLSVADSGPGIPDEHLNRVFDTFYRIEPDRGRETGGVGLGLAIVRTCVEACGGTVRARNRQKGGLRVIMELKFARPGEAETGAPFNDTQTRPISSKDETQAS